MSNFSPEQVQIEEQWKEVLQEEFSKPYFVGIKAFLLEERKKGQVFYPAGKDIFNAFSYTPFDAVKVVILGQDPYHGRGEAHGLCFSVPQGIAIPPSLLNIYKELMTDVGISMPAHGNLEAWARQGVLLLNAILTVRADAAASHRGIGWELFTDAVIQALNRQKEGIVFLLWGKFAQQKGMMIDTKKHFVLTAVHPSPLSAHRGFLGCRHFSQTNQLLLQQKKMPINWQIV